ncbi:hypothetical protein B0H16DRAFT_1493301 [Mycena metata]|uniref:DUF6534 domain-containing protein n=1 Tax=Mycena metata TaxID=1033252 RepID=A0AAD7KHB8_9AGAR|nr:hypothetical protein B0H16DRAFT_1493301 [Mycena metata]
MNSDLSLDPTIGVYEIGVLISFALLGVATTQTYIYYTRFPDDSVKLKTLLLTILFRSQWYGESTFRRIICSYTITAHLHPDILIRAPTSLGGAVFVAGIITACVQGFFTFRIYAFQKRLIPIFLWTTSILRLLGSIVAFVMELRSASLADYEAQWGWLFTTIWSLSVVNDVTITATLVVLLYRRRPNMLQRTTALVDKLIAWTIETGMLTRSGTVRISNVATTANTHSLVIWVATFSFCSLNSRTTLRAMNEIPTPSLKLPDDWPTNGGQASKVSELVFVIGSRTTSNGTNIVSRNT